MMFWIAVLTISLWVLFSGGTPVIQYILYRALFVAWALLTVVVAFYAYETYGLGGAVLAFGALFITWQTLVGPIVFKILGFRKNPKTMASH